MSGNGHISPFERRLRELEQESALLDHDMRKLRRSIEKAERTGTAPELPPLRHEPIMSASAPVPESTLPEPDPEPRRPLWRTPESVNHARMAAREAMAREAESSGGRRDFSRNERFASYLASGSFGKARPLGREKKVQRNKAIFMLITALLFAFIVIRVFVY
jgi:hypothetical protein